MVGDGIIVGIEPDVGRFACLNLDALLAGERVIGKRDEVGALLGEDLSDGALWVFGNSDTPQTGTQGRFRAGLL